MKRVLLVVAIAVAGTGLGAGYIAALPQHGGHGGHSTASESLPSVRTGKIKGKIVEVDETSITVETQEKGKPVRTTCLIDPRTKTKGNPAAGEEVVVKYREEEGRKTATSIEIKKPKSPSK